MLLMHIFISVVNPPTPRKQSFIEITLSVFLPVCPYFTWAQPLQNVWTNIKITLHSYSIQPEDVHEER